MHKLTYGFVLGYHGCPQTVAKALLAGAPFKASENDYDWLGHGVYFWEANPKRGLAFAKEALKRKNSRKRPAVIGTVIDLGHCLDLTTEAGIDILKTAHAVLKANLDLLGRPLPVNGPNLRRLDCAVIEAAHTLASEGRDMPPFDTVKGVFVEGTEAYPGSGFNDKTHIQIAVRNPKMIKGVFRVDDELLK
ncbi:MAG: hypothetical protein PW843_00970 [Azospirillaceae bacterium]|nr:hypothetical protein [Azospirillaceae bacterium]